MSFRIILLGILLVPWLAFSGPSCPAFYSVKNYQLTRAVSDQIQYYLDHTLNGIESMRGESGFVSDAIWVHPRKSTITTLNADTSLSNIAVDLLIQTELLDRPRKKSMALPTLKKVISALETLPFHKETGLFYSRYSSNERIPQVKHFDVSSIDSLHLAIALWTIHKRLPESDLAIVMFMNLRCHPAGKNYLLRMHS